MLILVAAAVAHVPHDVVMAVAAAPGVPWYAVAEPGGPSLLLRSDDEGETWAFVGGAPAADRLVGAVLASDGTPVLLGEAGYGWVADGVWVSDVLPGAVTFIALDGETLLLAGPDGIWGGAPGAMTREIGVAVTSLGDGVALTTSSVLVREDGSWIR
mgnify:CR=1 FL=1